MVHGDCLKILPMLPDRLVDHVITDPPYEAEAHTKNRRLKSTSVDGANWVAKGGQTVQKEINFNPMQPDDRAAVGAEIARLVARWSIVFCQCEGAALWRETLSALVYKRTCVWVKPDAMPQLTGDRPGMGYESFVCHHPEGRSEWNGGGRNGVFVHQKDVGAGAGIRNDHPTTKPQGLMVELLGLFTSPGDLVLDPYAGSGSTGIAALRLGRRAILIEKDPKYAALCIERMTAEGAGSTLSAYRNGQLSILGDAPPLPPRKALT